ncbi:Fe(3+) dicitrate transport system permease protein FecD [Escherichia coli]|nr:Fe(3+) dicitrate transport system permease protein FecD [Escherichia coli]
MTAIKHPMLLWGLPVAALIIIFWLSLFCYSAIPVSGADATRALLPGHTPTLPEALVQNLRLPRSLVAVLIGASLALAGTLLQTLTHNPMASPSLLGINSGAALAMALTSALSPTPIAGYSLSFIAACGGGVSWLLVMTAGGGFRHTHDRNKLILAGIALSAFCMGLTRITLLLAEDHAYGIFYWLAGGVSHARWQDVWQLLPVVVTAVPVVLLLANQLNLLNLSDSTAHTLGVNLTRLRLVINMLVLLLVGACVSVAGHRSAGATSGALLGRLRSAQRTASEHAAGGHADVAGRCTRTRAGLPRRSARRRSAGADWQPLLCLACEEARMKIALVIFITLALAGCALLSLHMGVIPVPWRALLTDWQAGREHYYVLMEYRLPRLLLALFVGAALAVAGVLIQGIVRNPLASPDILGVNHAASLASVGALLLMPSLPVMVLPLLAFAGGMAGLILLKMLAKTHQPMKLALTGVALSACWASLTDYLMLSRPQDVNNALLWLTGSLWGRDWSFVKIAIPLMILFLPLSLSFCRDLDLLALGDARATTLGVSVPHTRFWALLLAVAMTSTGVAACGPISFIGLVVPHMMRSITGGRHRRLLPVSALTGALLLVVADLLARIIHPPLELPVGVLTAIIGAPWFVWLLVRMR